MGRLLHHRLSLRGFASVKDRSGSKLKISADGIIILSLFLCYLLSINVGLTPRNLQPKCPWVSCLSGTGAQEWHIVSLLGGVTSPNTVAHYASMTSYSRVLSTEKR